MKRRVQTVPLPLWRAPSPSHPTPRAPLLSVSSWNDQPVGEGDPRLQPSEKSPNQPPPVSFPPFLSFAGSFPPSLGFIRISSAPPPPSSCSSPFLPPFCLFPCPRSSASVSALSCLPSPLLHSPLLFSLLLPDSPHILVSSPPPALSPSFSCPDLTLSTLSHPDFPLRRRIPWPPPSATEGTSETTLLAPPRVQRGQLPRWGPWVPQEVAGDRMGWPSWPQPCYLWDRSVPSRPHRGGSRAGAGGLRARGPSPNNP